MLNIISRSGCDVEIDKHCKDSYILGEYKIRKPREAAPLMIYLPAAILSLQISKLNTRASETESPNFLSAPSLFTVRNSSFFVDVCQRKNAFQFFLVAYSASENLRLGR